MIPYIPLIISLLQCLHNNSIPNSLIITPKSPNFTTTLLSSAQNQRIISSLNLPKPLLIITPTKQSHIQSTIICSKDHNFTILTRSGGHDYEGLSYSSTIHPSLILDLSNLRNISFHANNTVWAQSGATLGELYFAIASKSRLLAFPAGFCPTVGVGGHISGGGIGTIMREHGIAADHVVDIRMVNSKGEILERDSMGEDLFWALRGGGGSSFGVIIAYKIKLVKVPPKVSVFSKALTLSQGATKAVVKWQQMAYKLDNRLYINANLNPVNKTVLATFSGLLLGELQELLLIMELNFPELKVSSNDCKEMSWIESLLFFSVVPVPTISGSQMPLTVLLNRSKIAPNVYFKAKSDIVSEPIVEESWKKIWKYILKGNEQIRMLIEPLGGKIADVSETETPFPHRNGSKFVIQYILAWTETGEKESNKHVDWIRRFYKFMSPFVSKNPRAAYLNFRDLDLGKNSEGVTSYGKAEVWGRKYYKVNFKRLANVKFKTDPDNFFKSEQSIPPLVY